MRNRATSLTTIPEMRELSFVSVIMQDAIDPAYESKPWVIPTQTPLVLAILGVILISIPFMMISPWFGLIDIPAITVLISGGCDCYKQPPEDDSEITIIIHSSSEGSCVSM